MATTTYSSLRYPLSSATPNVSQDLQNLANDVDQKVTIQVASPTARNALTAGQKYDGMRVYEQSTRRYYRWDGTASAWAYDGGAPPPIVAITLAGGWTAGPGSAAGAYIDASGLVSLVGAVSNTSLYDPNVGATMGTLPPGYWPAKGRTVGAVYIGNPVDETVFVSISTSGVITVQGESPSGTIAANSGHNLDGVRFHPTFAGTVPLA